MTDFVDFTLNPIGYVESPLADRHSAPRQPDETAPSAWLVFSPAVRTACADFAVGQHILLLTWLDRAVRDVQQVYPQNDLSRPLTGVFSTRSPDRPNPIGLHQVEIIEINDLRIGVRHLEAINKTPILDVKSV
jgi:tRNA-Thr(GGU) m(6)t(6)A37 methyltransferase TsaA